MISLVIGIIKRFYKVNFTKLVVYFKEKFTKRVNFVKFN